MDYKVKSFLGKFYVLAEREGHVRQYSAAIDGS